MHRALLVLLLALAACGGGDPPREPNVIAPPAAAVPIAPEPRAAAVESRAPAIEPRAAAAGAPAREQLRGGRVVFPFAGTRAPRRLLLRIRRGHAAGVLLLGRNVGPPATLRALTRSLHRAARAGGQPPPLVMVDQEGGSVKRLPGAPRRSAPAMTSTAIARAEGRATARTLRRAGVNVDLAPVADVVRPGSALDREGRGFRGDVPALARAFAEGLQAGGVAATYKHFPGFGTATTNTDFAAQRLAAPTAADLAPYRDTPARLVMFSSAVYPALSDRPAVLSRAVAKRLRDLGFTGTTVSDDLETPALAGRDVTRAQADVLLFARTYSAAARAAERLPADRAAFDRVQALRRSLAPAGP